MINKDIFKIFILTLIITNSLIIGFLPGLLYFYFLPIISLIILITILWFTNYNSLKKIVFSILPIIIVPICILIWKKINTVEPEIFLIPKNYRGFVYISYNHKCGTPIKYKEDSRVYEIPNDGVLLTQFKDEQGFINQRFYIIDNEKRVKIEELMVQDFNEEWTLEKNKKEPPRDKLAIFYAGRTYSNGNSEFFIGTYNDLKKDYYYEKRIDSTANKKIEKLKTDCR